MARRKAPARNNKRQKQSSSGMLTWLTVFAMSVGAIWVYENRAAFFPAEKHVRTAQAHKPNGISLPAQVPVPAKAPVKAPSRAPDTRTGADKPLPGPIPPRPVGQSAQPDAVSAIITAAVPDERNQSGSATSINASLANTDATDKIVPSQQFSFCGRSGLKNCVEDGRVFWREGKKQVLSGITVPRTDEAACVEERRKGFAAKVRLRDFLNAGSFSQHSTSNGLSVSRNGARFEEQLIRDGLAMPIGQKNQSWCS